MINGHGDDSYLFDKEIVADFSSNVYYEGISTELKKYLSEKLYKINNYPEANAQCLQKQLAQWHHVNVEQVLVTNGATEAFYLIAHTYRNQAATIIIPAFSEYEDACGANDMQLKYLEWNTINETSKFDTDIVFFGNPNNPTGSILSKVNIHKILHNNPQTIFIIDEAYIDFTKDSVSMIDLISQFENLIIIKSLTKTYSIPGLRLGYILSNSSIINKILSYKMPWSVNSLAIEAGMYIIKNCQEMLLPIDMLLNDTKILMNQLKKIENISVFETNTNFFLCKTNKGMAADLKQFLLNEYGLLIRDASNFKSLSPQHFRIATQTTNKNELLVKGIGAWMKSF